MGIVSVVGQQEQEGARSCNRQHAGTTRIFCPAGTSRVDKVWFHPISFLLCGLWLCGGLLLTTSPTQAEVKAGDILVVDQNGGTRCGQFNFPSAVIALVNPHRPTSQALSDFGNPAQGRLGNGASLVLR